MPLKQESRLTQATITDVLSGKSSAYEQLYRTHAGRIYTFGLKFFEHSKQAAEELTRRVFVKAYEVIESYPENITFILWLKKLAVEEIKKGDIQKSGEIHTVSPADEAIYSLPEEERIAFILSDVEKLSIEEVEEIIQDLRKNINEKLEAARKTIMEKLKIDSTDKLDYKISFFSIKSEPREDLWEIIYDQIHSIATKNIKEEKNGEILNVGDAKITISEKFQKIKKEEKRKAVILKGLGLNINTKALFTASLILLFGLAIWFLFIFSSVKWEVESIAGSPEIKNNYKSKVVENATLLESDEFLTTNNKSKAVIKISGVGSIFVNPGSSVRRINEKGKLLLNNGDIKIVKEKKSEPFPIEVLYVKIVDYIPGTYNLLAENKKAEIYSESASLTITKENRKIYVLPGYKCEIQLKGNPGIPYTVKSSNEYISALNDYIFNKKKDKLNIILLLSDRKDAMTLFNLLPVVDKESRIIVVNKLQSLVRLPADITPRQMSNLKEEDLEKWLNSIESIN